MVIFKSWIKLMFSKNFSKLCKILQLYDKNSFYSRDRDLQFDFHVFCSSGSRGMLLKQGLFVFNDEDWD